MADQRGSGRIAIIGSGFVGRSWALLFAAAGYAVSVNDPDPSALDAVSAGIAASLAQLSASGVIRERSGAVLTRIRTERDLATALEGADYVQESAPERLDVKRALFANLDRLSPPTAILASSSSSLTCSQICGELTGRSRCLIAHPANPPHLLRAVELVPAPFTDPSITARAAELLANAGQVPVEIREIDGFVMNRLQAALVREALSLIETGIADAPAIDAIVKHSLGVRWAFMGPFETMDLNAPGGFADYAERYGPSFAALFGERAWPDCAVQRVVRDRRQSVPLDELPKRRGWRDRRLASLVAHLRKDS
jgi:3-hydroxyacyl-CoA dehydrogenase